MKEKQLKIVISGNIGVGKSTLCSKIVEHQKIKNYLHENSENPYLEKFYVYLGKHPDEYNPYILPLTEYFLKGRFEKVKNWPKDEKIFIQERFLIEIYEVFILTCNDIGYYNKNEFEKVKKLYESFLSEIELPDAVINLKCQFDLEMKRIEKRGIGFEQKNIESYVKNLTLRYEKFPELLKKKYGIVVFIIDTNKLNSEEIWIKTNEIINLLLK